MKIKLVILFTLLSLNIWSQSFFNSYQKGTLDLRNGTQLRGFVKITGNKIKFKKTKKDKKQIFDYRKVKRLKFRFEDEYLYKLTVNKKKKLLIKREIKGKLNLYSMSAQSPGIPNGHFGTQMMGGGSYTVYYIGRENSVFIEKLSSNSAKKKFLKILSKYTSDCQDFLNKIKDKESIEYYFENKESDFRGDFKVKDSRIESIINYYNSHCNLIESK